MYGVKIADDPSKNIVKFDDGSEARRYVGLLKEPPEPVDKRGMEDFLTKYAEDQNYFSPRVRHHYNICNGVFAQAMPSCCAVSVLQGFKYLTKAKIQADLGQFVYTIAAVLEAIDNNPVYGGYVMVSFSQADIAKGLPEIFEEYFGFVLLENEFANKCKNRNAGSYEDSRIIIMGLNLREYKNESQAQS